VRIRTRTWTAIAFTLILATAAPTPCFATRTPTDYDVKAAYLLHFVRLVEWPNEAASEPVVIAILRDDALAAILEQLVSADPPKRPLRIVRGRTIHALPAHPHVLFVGANDLADARQTLRSLGSGPTLTVGDIAGFAANGGMIGFEITAEGRVSFEVNLDRSDEAGLRMSSQLLKVARRIRRTRK
jgi:hypothetical protein